MSRLGTLGNSSADTPPAEISLFLGELSGGGAERVMVTLANGFARCGRSVDLLLASASGPYLDEVDGQVRVVDLEAGSSLRALPALVRYLRSRRPRALLTTLHHTGAVALLAKWLSGATVRVYLREANTLSAIRPHSFKGRALARTARYVYRLADGVVAVSQGVADDLRAHVPRITTIYNPVVGPDLFAKSEEDVEHPWFSEPGSRVVLAAGRLTAQKDFFTLIRAFAMLAEPGVKLVILGEGEDRERLQALVDSLRLTSRVDMPGFVRNPFAYMARASLFVLSSRWEGMPGVLIQALACGCPVVSSDCPSGPSEVLEGGRFGELVPVGDAAALAQAMARRLAMPPDRARLKARAADFSEQASIASYLDLLLPQRTAER